MNDDIGAAGFMVLASVCLLERAKKYHLVGFAWNMTRCGRLLLPGDRLMPVREVPERSICKLCKRNRSG
jgi:hypothetical protein